MEILTATIKTAFLIGFFGGLAVVVGRWFYFQYNLSLKHFLRYRILKKKLSDADFDIILDTMTQLNTENYQIGYEKKLNPQETGKIKRYLLLRGYKLNKVREILWIFNNFKLVKYERR